MDIMLIKIVVGALVCMISAIIYAKNIQSEINK